MHKRNVNTDSAKSNKATEKNRQRGQQSAKTEASPLQQIRRQVQEIETRTCDIEILLETVFEKIDRYSSAGAVKTLDAINTLATCALRNVALIREHYEHIGALTNGGEQ